MKTQITVKAMVVASLVILPSTVPLVADDKPAACPPCCGTCLPAQPTTAPSVLADADKTTLLAMRREEKLAHDVYVTLGRKYDLMPFNNIPRSELQHQRAIALLLERHAIADPVEALPEGRFDDPGVQALFDKLVAKGSESEIAALKVGAEIEELDIRDLRAAAANTSSRELKDTYAALERASENHLRAFARNLSARNATYEAAHLEQAEFDRIATSGRGSGRGPRWQ